MLNDGKINISDIVNNLDSSATNKPLSAAQGKAINDRFMFNTLIEPNKSASVTIKTNKIYLVCVHTNGDKGLLGLLSTIYSTHFTNLISDTSVYLNWNVSGNTITFVNMHNLTIGLSITEM